MTYMRACAIEQQVERGLIRRLFSNKNPPNIVLEQEESTSFRESG